MFTRRAFLGSVIAALATSSMDARWYQRLIRVGIAESLIHGQPKDDESNLLKQSMSEVFEVPGKPKCQFEFDTAAALAKRLQCEELNLSVMSGLEYAWIGNGYPDLAPLVIAYTTDVRMKACLLVLEESNVKTVLDLRGKSICLPERLPQHAYIYLHQAIHKRGGNPEGFFGRSLPQTDSNEGIESVIDEKADAILLDVDSWKGYQERKPARAKKLRMLDQSMAFPTAAVLYHKNSWNKLETAMFKLGLCTAHQKPYSRQLLNFWGISKFVLPTALYRRTLEDVLCEIPQSVTPADLVAKK